jgi:hypothetical protein
MLTPAEELGLSGLGLTTRVRGAFARIPKPQLVECPQRIRAEAFRRHLIYRRDVELNTGRASQRQVVNVAQRGGTWVVMPGHPPARIIGPHEYAGWAI